MIPANRHVRRVRRERIGAYCDSFVTWALVGVLVVSPFAFGSVHPPAFGAIELMAGLLTIAWIVRLRFGSTSVATVPRLSPILVVPLVGFVALALLQVVPLPPSVLRVLAPGSYELYASSLPGWPDDAPYGRVVRDVLRKDDVGVQPSDLNRPVVLPSVEAARDTGLETAIPDAWGRVAGDKLLRPADRSQLERWIEAAPSGPSGWRTVSIDPRRTWSELLKIVAYVLLFTVVSFYPLERGSPADLRFQRRLFRAIAFTAVAVAALGLLQRAAWNGKLLWVFVPWDWGVPRVDDPQTSGPFVSRNNFGGYLALTLPLVAAFALVPTRLDFRRRERWTRVAFGCGAAVMGAALLFSLSRGSWISAGVGLAVLGAGLVRGIPAEKRPRLLRLGRSSALTGLLVAAAVLALVLMPTGGARLGSDVDRRLEQTISDSASWDSRWSAWSDSVPMIRDFAPLGAGLGAWGSIFPKYDSSFYFGVRLRRAHNDYLQLLAEMGLPGLLMMALVLGALGARLVRATRDRSPRMVGPAVAICAGLLALSLHELVDFDLQIPAIVVTAVVLTGLGLRPAWSLETSAAPRWHLAGAGAVAFLALVALQPGSDRAEVEAGNLGSSLRTIARRPYLSSGHLALGVDLASVDPSDPSLAREPLDVAVALNPSSPGPRDARAVLAAQVGDEEFALREIEESTYRSPSRIQHPMLVSESAAWLPPRTRAAAARGFERAIDDAGFKAAASLASFHAAGREHREAAAAWEQAARLAPTRAYASTFLRHAGWELTRVEAYDEAEETLRRSIALAPGAESPRVVLIRNVFGPRRDLDAARAAAEDAIAAGADRYEIRLALAEAARLAEAPMVERALLTQAVEERPGDPRGHYQLGLAEYRQQRYERSMLALESATRLSPDHAGAWFYLGLAAERAYRFDVAGGAFETATRLDPVHAGYRRNQIRFQRRLANG